MLLLYAVTLLHSAALLFLVQPLWARLVLPLYGGAPAVWSAAMLFFQTVLLLGYGYAHFATTRLAPRPRVVLHLTILAIPLLLPLGLPPDSAPLPGLSPVVPLLQCLARSVGVPFFALATTSPMLQRWFTGTGHSAAADPYFLYSASNIGSLLGLLAYPLVCEPNLDLPTQLLVLRVGQVMLLGLAVACAVPFWRQVRRAVTQGEPPGTEVGAPGTGVRAPGTGTREAPPMSGEGRPVSGDSQPLSGDSRPVSGEGRPVSGDSQPLSGEALPVPWPRLLLWTALAAAPSALMLGVTTYLSSAVASLPLLWVLPLALYLLSFVTTFARRPLPLRPLAIVAPMVVAPLGMTLALGANHPMALLVPLHLLAFVLLATLCHGRLAALRPAPRHLTVFYLCLSLGGALGGLWASLAAPVLFTSIAEYPLGLALAALLGLATAQDRTLPRLAVALLPGSLVALGLLALRDAQGPTPPGPATLLFAMAALGSYVVGRRTGLLGLAFLGVAAAAGLYVHPLEGRVIRAERSFFGVHRVAIDAQAGFLQLFHGVTVHGRQGLAALDGCEPLLYYHRSGPIGQVFAARQGDPQPVGVVGLGTGALACYGNPGQRWTFYEIDPLVERIARQDFTYLRHGPGQVRVVQGDARLSLQTAPLHDFGVLVLDAYSSDSIPLHLLTAEALSLYQARLRPHGLLAFHISNRYFDLAPVLGQLAEQVGWRAWVRDNGVLTASERSQGKSESRWLLMAQDPRDLRGLAEDPRWHPQPGRTSPPPWTDARASALDAFVW